MQTIANVYTEMSPLVMGSTLIEDGIREYKSLIANKDMLIRFLICMVENNRFEFIDENQIEEFLEERLDSHKTLCNDSGCRYSHPSFNAEKEYGVRKQGEI